MAALGLVADDDDDANTAVAAQQRRQQAAKRKPDPHAAELLRAAHGLRASQIKEAFVSVGLEARPVDGRVFDGVPAEKAALLCEALASMEREGVAA